MAGWSALMTGITGMVLTLGIIGCGRSESPTDTTEPESGSAQADVEEPTASAPASSQIPAPDVPEDAPVLSDVYPTLSSGALRYARLTDLPDGVLLRAEGLSLTQKDMESELAQVPPHMREQMKANAFVMLEQKATMELLTAVARQSVEDTMNEDQLLQNYFEELTRNVSVTDKEISEFYEQNREMIGDASMDQVKERIRNQLSEQKQQKMIERHIAELGREMTIALSAPWVKEQAAQALDNPVDKARTSGKPTFVNFGASGCAPCDMMEPVREELKAEHSEQLNVVYVNVNEQPMLSSRYGVSGIPHLVFFDKNGKQVHTHTGFMPKEQIEGQIKKMGVEL
ncbi:MAG: thioredoxin family protein [Verrucomicrobiota bacterium]